MNTLDWDKLRVFHAVAGAGSLTHAGKVLDLSQSSVSRQISALEESLGVSLFRRHARGLVLTEQGEMLQEATADIYDKLSLIKGQLVDAHHQPEGPLTVIAPELVGSTLIAPRIATFKNRYPDIQLTLLFEERIINLNMKKADIAIRLRKPEEVDHIQRYLTTINFHICASKKYLKLHGTPKTKEDLKNHTLLGMPSHVHAPLKHSNWLYEIVKSNPLKDNNLLMMNSMYAIYRATLKNAGISVLPDYMIQYRKEDMQIILPEIEPPSADMYFVYAQERKNSTRIQAFRDFLLDNIRSSELIDKFE
ncbi:LysR family transcriptional regulator [Alphaproteobacteria bacterium]|nr:LysR family transcriptional regulator [Alphaproteobacteria bacterium]